MHLILWSISNFYSLKKCHWVSLLCILILFQIKLLLFNNLIWSLNKLLIRFPFKCICILKQKRKYAFVWSRRTPIAFEFWYHTCMHNDKHILKECTRLNPNSTFNVFIVIVRIRFSLSFVLPSWLWHLNPVPLSFWFQIIDSLPIFFSPPCYDS